MNITITITKIEAALIIKNLQKEKDAVYLIKKIKSTLEKDNNNTFNKILIG